MVDSIRALRNVSMSATTAAVNLFPSARYDGPMNMPTCGGGCGWAGRWGVTMRLPGVFLVLALLFSGAMVRIHGHPDDAPASTDCVACAASLAAAVETSPPPSLDPPAPAGYDASGGGAGPAPSLVFVRQGGLRDPPTPLA
jgi:hypothetical protein